jgi:hypothetical protein
MITNRLEGDGVTPTDAPATGGNMLDQQAVGTAARSLTPEEYAIHAAYHDIDAFRLKVSMPFDHSRFPRVYP